jgi:general stress protein 26
MDVADSTHKNEFEKISELMKGIRFAMLTTVEPDGSLHSRPMATQEVEFDGDLWFFTRADAPKVSEANQHRQVSVSFADPEKSKFLSASGPAILVRDRAKIEELWKPHYKVFFPEGLDDPELALLKVTVERAEYWDSSPTSIGRAIDFAKAYITKDPSKLGDHAKVDLK